MPEQPFDINSRTEIYGIIGNPVKHSLSPVIHNAALRHSGINAVYLAFEVHEPVEAIKGIKALGIKGVSVTVPHKESVLNLLDKIDETAARIGAINTISNRNGILEGYNTDMTGAVRALTTKTKLCGKQALVLGAGGSAKAIVAGLVKHRAKVHIANRTISKAESLANKFGVSWSGLDTIDSIMSDQPFHVIINTTLLGMHPNSDTMPVSWALLNMAGQNNSVVMDIVYSPLETRLLKEASKQGCNVINGLEMLLWQAVEQFEIWTGHSAPVEIMRSSLYSAVAKK